jgi:hypothetical protein
MSVVELKKTVLAMPPKKRHEFVVWAVRHDTAVPDYGGISDEEATMMTAQTWRDLDEREEQDAKRKARRSVAR